MNNKTRRNILILFHILRLHFVSVFCVILSQRKKNVELNLGEDFGCSEQKRKEKNLKPIVVIREKHPQNVQFQSFIMSFAVT